MKNIFTSFNNKNQIPLAAANFAGMKAVKYSVKAYILTALVLLPPFILNYLTMIWSSAMIRQNPRFSFAVFLLPLAFPIAFGILVIRELIRCKGYSPDEKKYIKSSSRFRGAVLVTYCVEKLKRDRMIWVELLPNICITLPLAAVSFFFRSIASGVISMMLSITALLTIGASVHDLLKAVSLLDYEKDDLFCVNREGEVYRLN